MAADQARRRRYLLGHAAEGRAALWLRLKGYRILDRRYRTPRGEIDIVARRGGVVAMVEVKARATSEAALEAIGPAARRRIVEAAYMWLARHPACATDTIRFDAVLVIPGRLPRHLPDLFPAHR